MSLETPIAFCIFNRPDLTKRVFEAIARQRPRHLLVIGDGPRVDRPDEARQVAETRRVIERVDWDCDVRLQFSDTNLGCRRRIETGLTWAFDQHEELIILEDDCLPDDSFFHYCQTLLRKYRDDHRVMMISGDQFNPQPESPYSYYFSKWAHIWGWASWRRAWNLFDEGMTSWPEAKENQWLESMIDQPCELDHWTRICDQLYQGEIDTWDWPWMYSCWIQSGLTILPHVNLVTNIGFDERATHTRDPESFQSRLPTGSILSLRHPPNVSRDCTADRWTLENIFQHDMTEPQRPPWLSRKVRQVKRILDPKRYQRAAA